MNPLDPTEFRRQGHMVIDFLADYYENIHKYPVRSQVKPGYLLERLPDCAPSNPESLDTILNDVQSHIIPGITHWQSPNFFAYFASSGSTGSFLGEMLLNGFNVVGFNWLSSPAATELEMVVMEWLLKLLQLPKSFSFSSDGGGGVLLGTTCEAFICTLLAAKEKKLDQVGGENADKLVIYCSDQTHFSLRKAAKIVGIKPENVRQILTTMSMNFQLSPLLLDELVQRDVDAGLIPMYLCTTVGTTSTTSVDPLGPLCEVSSAYDIWVHVDAAYAGSACICPEFSHFLDGVVGASSFSFNAHKWLLTNQSCCCLWVKDRSALTKPLTTNSEFLKNSAATDSRQVVDYKDWQIMLTRRFQALKIWMVLRSYGTNGLREFIRKHVKMAKDFEAFVRMDKRFEIIVPRNFSVVCFRVSPYVIGKQCDSNHEANEFNQKLLESVNLTGRIYMTNSVVGGIYVIRFAVGATLTEDRHVQIAWELVKDHTTSLLTDRVQQQQYPIPVELVKDHTTSLLTDRVQQQQQYPIPAEAGYGEVI